MKDVRSIYKNYPSFIYTVYSILRKSGICSFVFFFRIKKKSTVVARKFITRSLPRSQGQIFVQIGAVTSRSAALVSAGIGGQGGNFPSLLTLSGYIITFLLLFLSCFFFLLTTAMSVGGIRGLYPSSFPKGSLNYHTLLVKKRRRPKTA